LESFDKRIEDILGSLPYEPQCKICNSKYKSELELRTKLIEMDLYDVIYREVDSDSKPRYKTDNAKNNILHRRLSKHPEYKEKVKKMSDLYDANEILKAEIAFLEQQFRIQELFLQTKKQG